MKNIYRLFYVAILLLLQYACINPVEDFTQVAYKRFLTVEAVLTNQVGPYKVKIYQSADKISGASAYVPETLAKVYLTTATGSTIQLAESATAAGTYLTPDAFVGVVGETYTLHIVLSNGKEYESLPEKMKKAPAIDNLITQFEVNEAYYKGDVRRAGFNVYVDFQDDAQAGDYYQWYWRHYEKAPYCATCYNGAKYNFTKNYCEPPKTVTDDIWNYLCSAPCWNVTLPSELNLFSDALMNGKRITGRQILRVPFTDYSPYYVLVEQRAITEDAYNYYQSLVAQVQNTGTLFDVPAETRFSLNIKGKTDPSEKILGLFDVYSVSKKVIYVERMKGVPSTEAPVTSIIPGQVYTCPVGSPPTCQEKVPCFEGINRTPFKPEGWVD